MIPLLLTLLSLVPAALPSQARGEWHPLQGTSWEYQADGRVYAHFEGFNADPGEIAGRVVSFDSDGSPTQVTVLRFLGMDATGVSLARESWMVSDPAKAAFRTKYSYVSSQPDGRAQAIEATLAAPSSRVERMEFRLPPLPQNYRMETPGVLAANNALSDQDDPRSHMRIGFRILRDTTIIAELRPS